MVPHLTGCYWLASEYRNRWLAVLYELGLIDVLGPSFKPSTENLAEGHIELRVKGRGTQTLIHAVSGHGDVISYDQIVTLNTLLDSEQLSSCIVVTLGKFADQAMTLVNRLSTRKGIQAIDGQEFERLWVSRSTSSLVPLLKSLDVSAVAATLLIRDKGYALLLMDQLRREWFQVVDEAGAIVEESDGLIYQLRQDFPVLKGVPYRASTLASPFEAFPPAQPSDGDAFSKSAYLEQSYTVFDDVRYAPLAALGFRFRDSSLSDLYIETSADTGGAVKAAQTLQRAVSEYVESLNLDRSLRDQLETQLRSRYGLSRGAEVGLARKLYQRLGNVVVLGDPGSGKTCFVKHEMLAYCKPPEDNASWYEQHLPIFVPLAEAAELLRTEENFLSVCSVLAARNKLKLPENEIARYLSDGHASFFFDGLDEVSRIHERVGLLATIDKLVSKYAPYGNRFVLTSRPSAIQPVDIPEAFTYLHLKGLTDEEIRLLAQRVVTSRIGAAEQGTLVAEERELIQRLLQHVKNTPGLRRISRNPLLLTLLVLIYANTGTLSARRHIVYTQAIKTLVSFRHRETMEQVLPEADLRTHLGQLAYSIYRRDVSELPSRSEVIGTFVKGITITSPPTSDDLQMAEEFLRRIAEATGLLVIHGREATDEASEDVVSFMHHSFLEYYAAVGFLARDFESEIQSLANNPQWRDVITLMSGLLSEHQNISSFLATIVQHNDEAEKVTNERLRLAFDCGLECETPPLETQKMLADRLYESLNQGALRYSEQLRQSLATLLDRLVSSSGSEVFKPSLVRGIKHEDPVVAAAFIDFVGRLKETELFDQTLVTCFEEAFSTRTDTVIRTACAGALMRRPEFRTEKASRNIGACLKGNLIEKHAAVKAVESNPGLARSFVAELNELLDDKSQLISSSAAHCILVAGLSQEQVETKEATIRKAVARWQAREGTIDGEKLAISLQGSYLQELLSSEDPEDVAFAAGLVPLSDFDAMQAHKLLMETLRTSDDHMVARACLDSLRNKDGALELITLADTDFVCRLVDSRFRDIRIGAIKVLGMLPNDEQVISTLMRFSNMSGDGDEQTRPSEELDEAIKALGEHARKDVHLQKILVKQVLSSLPDPDRREFGDQERQRHLRSMLAACEKIGTIVDKQDSQRLLTFVKNFRTPPALKAQALRVYGRTVEPSSESVMELVEFLKRDHRATNEASYTAVFWFLAQCKRRVEYVRSVYSELISLRHSLVIAWERESNRLLDRIDSVGIEDIRRSLAELERLIVSYEEFSGRMKLSTVEGNPARGQA